jgi:hypothetical protein
VAIVVPAATILKLVGHGALAKQPARIPPSQPLETNSVVPTVRSTEAEAGTPLRRGPRPEVEYEISVTRRLALRPEASRTFTVTSRWW